MLFNVSEIVRFKFVLFMMVRVFLDFIFICILVRFWMVVVVIFLFIGIDLVNEIVLILGFFINV